MLHPQESSLLGHRFVNLVWEIDGGTHHRRRLDGISEARGLARRAKDRIIGWTVSNLCGFLDTKVLAKMFRGQE